MKNIRHNHILGISFIFNGGMAILHCKVVVSAAAVGKVVTSAVQVHRFFCIAW